MKSPVPFLAAAALSLGASHSQAALYSLFNVQGGPGVDTLWQYSNGELMNGTGIVAIGYFPSGVTTSQIDTVSELHMLLPSFTVLQSAVPGTSSNFMAPGYLAEDPVQGSQILAGNALLGRSLYVIASPASNWAAAQSSFFFAMFLVDTIKEDSPVENTYTGNPAGATPIIGTTGTYTGDPGLGQGTYSTIQIFVPEPSAPLLVMMSLGGFVFRRRRI